MREMETSNISTFCRSIPSYCFDKEGTCQNVDATATPDVWDTAVRRDLASASHDRTWITTTVASTGVSATDVLLDAQTCSESKMDES